jgi:hypothetical protein
VNPETDYLLIDEKGRLCARLRGKDYIVQLMPVEAVEGTT